MENHEFDKSVFSKNLNHLLKQNDMSIGQLESTIGLSAGYISRTVNPDSDKKLSIDAMWKIAKQFSVSIDDLIGRDLTVKTSSNTDMALEFISKLKEDTLNGTASWTDMGGFSAAISEELSCLGFFSNAQLGKLFRTSSEEAQLCYHLKGDVFVLGNAVKDFDLVIAPYNMGLNNSLIHYSFFLSRKEDLGNGYKRTPLFDTFIAGDSTLDDAADILYHTVKSRCNDIDLGNGAKRFILSYLDK